MQTGNDHPGSEQTVGADAQRFDRRSGHEDEDTDLTRACHDLAVANDAGPDPDPDAHGLPRTGHDQE